MSKFVNPPYPNCLKTFDDKLIMAPKDSQAVLQMFDMRKFDQGYSSLFGKCFSIDSCDYLIKKKTPLFDNQEAPFNFRFDEKPNFISKLKGSNRKSNFINLVVNIRED